MPPNIVELPSQSEPKIETNTLKSSQLPREVTKAGNYTLKIFQTTLNQLAHILIGVVVGISLIFAYGNGLPLTATSLHIIVCVLGYQLLMAQAILSLSPHGTWSNLKLVDKRRTHWILEIMGSGLAITGSFIKILDKSIHWNTYHGQFALVALIFTTCSVINGITSLWAFEFRSFLPGTLSKLTHICFGIVGFSASSIALCYGFDKIMFRAWLSDEIAYTIITFTSIYTVIVIINPLITFICKLKIACKR